MAHASESRMRANRTSGSMRRGEKRVMVHSANGHRTRKGRNGGAPPDLYTTALALHCTPLGPPSCFSWCLTHVRVELAARQPSGFDPVKLYNTVQELAEAGI